MGQYYNILTNRNNNYKVYDRSIKLNEKDKPEYMMAKLTEHSWIGNSTMKSLSNEIYKKPTKVAWVGDYSDETTEENLTNENLTLEKAQELHKIAWHGNKELALTYNDFKTETMLLVNWTKKLYVNMKEYIEKSTNKTGYFQGWCIHPLSLLTALGNGFGGGDYYGVNLQDVGSWCFDEISFEDMNKEQELLEQNFTKAEYYFKENTDEES